MNGRPLTFGSLIVLAVLATACHDWSLAFNNLDAGDITTKSSDSGTAPADTSDTGTGPAGTGETGVTDTGDTGNVDTDPKSSDTGTGPAGTGETGVTDTGDTGNVDTATVDIGIDWATIPAGSFWMGTPDGSCPADYPGGTACEPELGRSSVEELHYVTLTYAFELMQTEVTQAQFSLVMKYSPSENRGCDTCPVETVNWFEALAFANEMSTLAGHAQCYDCDKTDSDSDSDSILICSMKKQYTAAQKCPGYRLPTESEWEYAARATTLTAFYNGGVTKMGCSPIDPNLDAIGWYCWNSDATTQTVALKTPNAWGLYDMSGNVSEWTWDSYELYPPGDTISPLVDPVTLNQGAFRVCRGGNMLTGAKIARSGSRDGHGPDYRDKGLGFRLARSVL